MIDITVTVLLLIDKNVFTRTVIKMFTDIPLNLGLQQGYYSVREDGSTIQVCVEIESGYIASRSISLNYTTLEGSARGTYVTN